jgi:transposase
LQIDKLVTGDGHPLPPRLASEITREIARLALIQEQIATLERERDQAPTPCKASEKKRLQLMSLNGIGAAIAAVMTREVYYRQFDNRRQVAGFLGLATSPHDSGDVGRSQGISRAGRGHVRGTMIQAAWLWLKHQPKSAITRWFVQRTAGQSGRIRRIMIIAVARKLAIALWRFLEQGLVPQGAMLANR